MKRVAREWCAIALALSCVCAANLPVLARDDKATAATQPTWRTVDENWYTMELSGSKTGFIVSLKETDGSQIRSTTRTSMKMNRGADALEIATTSVFLETADGKPVMVESTKKYSAQLVESKWVFNKDGVEATSRQGGREIVTKGPVPEGEWLTPAAAERYFKAQSAVGTKEISYRSVQAETELKPFGIKAVRTGNEQIECNGKTIDVTVWTSTTDPATITSIEKRDADGKMVYQEATILGTTKMITRLSTKAEIEGVDVGPGPELMFQTFIKPDKPIENSMDAVKATLRLKMKGGSMPQIPAAGAQRVKVDDDKSVTLSIDISDNLAATSEEQANKEYLSASAMIDINDELVVKLAKRAVKDAGDDPMKRAAALRKAVNKHISKKGMQTAFASASETARMKTGDCSEHGVLLCALLRANEIPARVAIGLVYVDSFAGAEGIFGWHMWTQALIEGKWVDFDATLPVRYSAVHVLTATSGLKEGLGMEDLTSMLQLIGNLDIDVVEVKYE